MCPHGYILYHMCWKKGGQKYMTKVFANWKLREFKLFCLGSLGYTARTELNYHDYLVETSLVTGTMATRWAREQLRQTVAGPCTGCAFYIGARGGAGFVCDCCVTRRPAGAGNCQAPARGRATISLTIGNGHQWQLRANNGFRFKFKYHVINCQRAWQRGFNSLQLHINYFIKFLHRVAPLCGNKS